MSPSSSGSWPSRSGDIIDLDRYMRGNVRPSRALSEDYKLERLVVDGGGCKPRSVASGDARYKRASLDSGVSDGSYRHTRHSHTKHRRGSYQEDSSYYPHYEPGTNRTLSGPAHSSNSMHAFRTICEQALIEQQQQIARVAQLCERLTERAEKSEAERNKRVDPFERNKQSERSERLTQQNERSEPFSHQNERSERFSQQNEGGEHFLQQNERSERISQKKMRSERKASAESSISSSSRSTKDLKRKDTYRTQECKTYKIIMSKLDELNRLFATRPPRVSRPPRAPRTLSSSSVSVCDKIVATDPQRTYNRVLAPTQRYRCANISNAAPSSLASAARHTSPRTVTQAFAVDIAPRHKRHVPANVLTESIMKCESSSTSSHHSACDPRCGFDLEDPVHLYSQAKRLQKMSGRTRRTRSVEPTPVEPWLDSHVHGHRKHVSEHTRTPTLCSVCRSYWRYLRQCVPALARLVDSCKCS